MFKISITLLRFVCFEMKSIRETQTKKKKAEESKELDFLETNADFGIESKRDRKRLRK